MAENHMVLLAYCPILVLPLRFGMANELSMGVIVAG
jgi:hypothetical protein